ncbi:MAG: hypothetical protein TREMPRED_001752 [Tremellales sp. Tagirdzhanova-0007]|nr:MAG: hypothetical protein TREMPRED_001752 [Tremellales sp. Tagirdzhanova-0007]
MSSYSDATDVHNWSFETDSVWDMMINGFNLESLRKTSQPPYHADPRYLPPQAALIGLHRFIPDEREVGLLQSSVSPESEENAWSIKKCPTRPNQIALLIFCQLAPPPFPRLERHRSSMSSSHQLLVIPSALAWDFPLTSAPLRPDPTRMENWVQECRGISERLREEMDVARDVVRFAEAEKAAKTEEVSKLEDRIQELEGRIGELQQVEVNFAGMPGRIENLEDVVRGLSWGE